MSKRVNILGIETSCDETAIAVLECEGELDPSASSGLRFKVLAEVVSSQIETHRPFGGVVPNLAKREHINNLPIVYNSIIDKLRITNYELKDKKSVIRNPQSIIDLIAVTVGPGLEPCLWTGINFAENLVKELNKPLIGVNHLEGHIFSNWLKPVGEIRNSKFEIRNSSKTIAFPAIVLLVSGGHTMLILMTSLTEWEILGETKDDAVGEAFDKVARMLKLPYPGGPEIESLSKKFKKFKSLKLIEFPRPMIHEKNYDFSFSGLKTSVLYYLRDNYRHPERNEGSNISDKILICAAFQEAAIDVLVIKTIRAAEEFNAKSILLCGGVASNKALQEALKFQVSKFKDLNFFVPEQKYNGDNAVMIAAAAYFNILKNKYPEKSLGDLGVNKLTAQGNLSINSH